MSSLYEITKNIQELMFMIDENDGNFSDECLRDTFESLDYSFDRKIENWCKCIRNIESDIEEEKTELNRLKETIKKNEYKILRMKSIMAELMTKANKTRINTPLFRVNRVKIGGKLDIDPASQIPDEYKKEVTKTTLEVDRDKIREALQEKGKLPFARLYNSVSIQ